MALSAIIDRYDVPSRHERGRPLVVDLDGTLIRSGFLDGMDFASGRRAAIERVEALAAEDVVLSVDTMRASVAAASIAAGALIVNDVSAGQADVRMGAQVAELRTRLGTPPVFIAMHWRGHSDVMNDLAVYEDVAAQSAAEAMIPLPSGRDAERERRLAGGLFVGSLLVLIVMVSAFFWPVWTGQVLDVEQWQYRMWLPSWT